MKKTKNIYKMYAAWEFEKEIGDLEAQSQKGWQLVKGGLFHSKFAFDDSVEYRYALDFNQDIADPARYRETFAEQGWEYLNSTFNGWHFFRKVYDPSAPEEEYQIYTDTASRKEMADRWRRLACILGVCELVVGAVTLVRNFFDPAISGICLDLASVLLGLLLILSTRWMHQPNRRRTPGRMLIPVFVLLAIALVFGSFRMKCFRTQTEYIVPEEDSAWQCQFNVKLPDIYTLDVRVDAPENVRIVVVKESPGEESSVETYGTLPRYYTVEGTQIGQTARLFLTPGTYSIYTQYLSGAESGLAGQFEYQLD